MIFNQDLIKEAEDVAALVHQYQSYDIFPYTKHLRDVVNVLIRFGFTNEFIVAGWLHDSIEDGNLTYNKIKGAFGLHVAEMVYAVTDPKGRNRKEKKKIVYDDIRAYPDSIIIKLADRIANVENGIRMHNSEKTKMYAAERNDFKIQLYESTPKNRNAEAMWQYLDQVFDNI